MINSKILNQVILLPLTLLALEGSSLGAIEFKTVRRTLAFPMGGVTIKTGMEAMDGSVTIRDVTFDGSPGDVLATLDKPSKAYRLPSDLHYCQMDFIRGGTFTGFEMDLTFTPPGKGSSCTFHVVSKPTSSDGLEVSNESWYPDTTTGKAEVHPGRKNMFFINIISF